MAKTISMPEVFSNPRYRGKHVILAAGKVYTAKTGDVLRGMILNPAYEVLSWASLGALPHILRHYTKQVDKKATEEGSKKFLDNLSKKNESLEDKIIEVPFGEDKKSKERLHKEAL